MQSGETNEFEVPGIVSIGPGQGGLTVITVTAALATAEIYLHGGQITRFKPVGEDPVLWLSARSVFNKAKAIRGGVPVCFPWFGANEADARAPAHGFARLAEWRIESVQQQPSGAVKVVLGLEADAATRAIWPAAFSARQTITVGRELDVCLTITNMQDTAISFEEALHTYLVVSDVRSVTIEGLGGVRYADKLEGGAVKVQEAAAIAFTGETDRVYMDVPEVCVLHDPGLARRIEVQSSGSRDTVVWNPWDGKAARMADFGDAEWPGMVCIETANTGANRVELAAGAVHAMSATLRVVR